MPERRLIVLRFAQAAAFAVGLWLVWFFSPALFSFDGQALGWWGDSFGALSSLFAALGFSGIFATFWMQWEQLEIQKKQALSSEDYQHQERFESTYFELLKLLRELRNEMRFKFSDEYFANSNETNAGLCTGHQATRHAWREARYYIINKPNYTSEDIGQIYYDKVHKKYESGFGPYFRIVYTILKRIDTDTRLSEAEKIKYGNLLRASLTSYELVLIGINGLCDVSKDFNIYIVKYRMFAHLPPQSSRYALLFGPYPESAFASRD